MDAVKIRVEINVRKKIIDNSYEVKCSFSGNQNMAKIATKLIKKNTQILGMKKGISLQILKTKTGIF